MRGGNTNAPPSKNPPTSPIGTPPSQPFSPLSVNKELAEVLERGRKPSEAKHIQKKKEPKKGYPTFLSLRKQNSVDEITCSRERACTDTQKPQVVPIKSKPPPPIPRNDLPHQVNPSNNKPPFPPNHDRPSGGSERLPTHSQQGFDRGQGGSERKKGHERRPSAGGGPPGGQDRHIPHHSPHSNQGGYGSGSGGGGGGTLDQRHHQVTPHVSSPLAAVHINPSHPPPASASDKKKQETIEFLPAPIKSAAKPSFTANPSQQSNINNPDNNSSTKSSLSNKNMASNLKQSQPPQYYQSQPPQHSQPQPPQHSQPQPPQYYQSHPPQHSQPQSPQYYQSHPSQHSQPQPSQHSQPQHSQYYHPPQPQSPQNKGASGPAVNARIHNIKANAIGGGGGPTRASKPLHAVRNSIYSGLSTRQSVLLEQMDEKWSDTEIFVSVVDKKRRSEGEEDEMDDDEFNNELPSMMKHKDNLSNSQEAVNALKSLDIEPEVAMFDLEDPEEFETSRKRVSVKPGVWEGWQRRVKRQTWEEWEHHFTNKPLSQTRTNNAAPPTSAAKDPLNNISAPITTPLDLNNLPKARNQSELDGRVCFSLFPHSSLPLPFPLSSPLFSLVLLFPFPPSSPPFTILSHIPICYPFLPLFYLLFLSCLPSLFFHFHLLIFNHSSSMDERQDYSPLPFPLPYLHSFPFSSNHPSLLPAFPHYYSSVPPPPFFTSYHLILPFLHCTFTISHFCLILRQ